jgi:hypothetical protein
MAASHGALERSEVMQGGCEQIHVSVKKISGSSAYVGIITVFAGAKENKMMIKSRKIRLARKVAHNGEEKSL